MRLHRGCSTRKSIEDESKFNSCALEHTQWWTEAILKLPEPTVHRRGELDMSYSLSIAGASVPYYSLNVFVWRYVCSLFLLKAALAILSAQNHSLVPLAPKQHSLSLSIPLWYTLPQISFPKPFPFLLFSSSSISYSRVSPTVLLIFF